MSAKQTKQNEEKIQEKLLTNKKIKYKMKSKKGSEKMQEKKSTKTYSFKKGDVAPELACSYRGLLADGTYRMWKQYRFKVSKIKMDLETKGNGNKGGVEITGNFLNRSCDGLFYDIQDTEEGNEGLSWLDTIAEVKPATGNN